MKKRLILSLTIIAMLALVGCGKEKDTGVIIQAQDTGNNNKSEKVVGDSTPLGTTESKEDAVKEAIRNSESLVGFWLREPNDRLEIRSDGSARFKYNEDVYNGTYETDGSTYIDIKYTPADDYEYIDNPDGTFTYETITYDEQTIHITIKSINKDIMAVDYNGDEIVFNFIENERTTESKTKMNAEENIEDNQRILDEHKEQYGENFAIVIEDHYLGLSEEEILKERQALINAGINPDTGLYMTDEEKEQYKNAEINNISTETVE